MEHSTVLGMSNNAILNSINSHFLALRTAGIKRLPSGDLVVQTLTKDNCKSLIANQKWLVSLRSTGTVLIERFLVFVHAVQITNINTDKTKAV
jgi:hypothetical protein